MKPVEVGAGAALLYLIYNSNKAQASHGNASGSIAGIKIIDPVSGTIGASVTVPYGSNVRVDVTVKNVGTAPAPFRISGVVGTGRLWDRQVVGDPMNAAQLVAAAGAIDYVDTPVLAPNQSDTRSLYTAPLWKGHEQASWPYNVTITAKVSPDGTPVTENCPNAVIVTGQGSPQIVSTIFTRS